LRHFINGMVITPVDAVLAMAEPDIVPVKADEITATNAAPPRKRPAITLEISMTKSDAPDTTRKAPKIMNNVMFDEEMVVMMPNIPSSLYSERNNTSSSGKLAALKAPGRCLPKNRIYDTAIMTNIGIIQPVKRRVSSIAARMTAKPAIQSNVLNCQRC